MVHKWYINGRYLKFYSLESLKKLMIIKSSKYQSASGVYNNPRYTGKLLQTAEIEFVLFSLVLIDTPILL